MKQILTIVFGVVLTYFGMTLGAYGGLGGMIIGCFWGMTMGIGIPLYFQHQHWNTKQLLISILKRVLLAGLFSVLGLFSGAMIASAWYERTRSPEYFDPDISPAPGAGLGGFAEVMIGMYFGLIIGFTVGIALPVIWEHLSPKLRREGLTSSAGETGQTG